MGSVHKGVATLFFFEQRAVQDRGVAPLFRTCPGTKEATSKNSRREHPPPSRSRQAEVRVYVACVLVFVMHARSCLCRLLQPPCRKEDDIDKGDGRSSRSLHGDKQPQHSGEQPELVEAGPRVLTPPRSPYLREGVGSGVLRAYGGFYASSEDSSESS